MYANSTLKLSLTKPSPIQVSPCTTLRHQLMNVLDKPNEEEAPSIGASDTITGALSDFPTSSYASPTPINRLFSPAGSILLR